jgi:hypothetical protein
MGIIAWIAVGAALAETAVLLLALQLALQLRNLQSLVGIGAGQNTTVVFAALMTTIAELGSLIAREKAAASTVPLPAAPRRRPPPAARSRGQRFRRGLGAQPVRNHNLCLRPGNYI